jgi:hypothetical protein
VTSTTVGELQSTTSSLSETVTTEAPPQDKGSCESAGGRWGRIGLAPGESCNMPASDFGKECSDMGECEGACLADSPGKGEAVQGACSQWRVVVGCRTFVMTGKGRQICYD